MQSGAVVDAPKEGERRGEELPSYVAALGSTSRAHLTAARTTADYTITVITHR